MLARKRTLAALVVISAAAIAAAGCGGGGSKSSDTTTQPTTSSGITAPSNIKSAGKIVFCTDITYPPEEYYRGQSRLDPTSTSAPTSRS